MHIYSAYLCEKKKKTSLFSKLLLQKNEIETKSNVLVWAMSNICSRLVVAREKKFKYQRSGIE